MNLKVGDIVETFYNEKNINHTKMQVRGIVDGLYVFMTEKGSYKIEAQEFVDVYYKGDALRIIGHEEVEN